MKRIRNIVAIFVAVIIVIAIILGVWYFTPKIFLDGVEISKVTLISVFDGNTGKSFTINNSDEIKKIVENIQGIKMKKDNLSISYSGYGFSVRFMGENERVIDSFMINSSDTIRDDPFFYRCDGGLCFDYLKELEYNYVNLSLAKKIDRNVRHIQK